MGFQNPHLKKISHEVEYLAVRVASFVLFRVPRTWALGWGDFLGWLGFSVLRIRRKWVLFSLNRVFEGDKSPAELNRIGLRAYQNFCKSMIEFALLSEMSVTELHQRVKWDHLERLKAAVNAGHGVIVVTGHFGSWEMLAASAAAHGLPASVVADRMHNRKVDALITAMRTKYGCEVIQTHQSIRDFMRALRRGRILALLSDQDSRKSTVFVNFLGLPAATPAGAATLSLKTKAPILPVLIVRQADNRHIVYVEPEIEYTPSGNREQDVIQITQQFTQVIERYIRQYPEQWFWMHRRWKRQPKKSEHEG